MVVAIEFTNSFALNYNIVCAIIFYQGLDMPFEIGVGTSFYLRYATISPEVKFSYGLRDLRKISEPKFPLVTSLDKITSNFIYFTIL